MDLTNINVLLTDDNIYDFYQYFTNKPNEFSHFLNQKLISNYYFYILKIKLIEN